MCIKHLRKEIHMYRLRSCDEYDETHYMDWYFVAREATGMYLVAADWFVVYLCRPVCQAWHPHPLKTDL